jgi:hypothetical protein
LLRRFEVADGEPIDQASGIFWLSSAVSVNSVVDVMQLHLGERLGIEQWHSRRVRGYFPQESYVGSISDPDCIRQLEKAALTFSSANIKLLIKFCIMSCTIFQNTL